MTPWPQIRAGLLLATMCLGLVNGCPLPPPDKTPAWQRGVVEEIRGAQQLVLRPVRWIGPTLRVGQRWALYQAPGPERFRLWVEGQDANGRWHLLFRAGDPEHTDYAPLIDYSRPRGAWDPTDVAPAQYPLFARWITRRVLADHADYVASRVRLEQVTITDDGLAASGRFIQPHVRMRSGPP